MTQALPNIKYCLIFISLFLFSCSATRKLEEGEYLLKKNVVVNDYKEIKKDEFKSFIRQKPNRKILGFLRFYLLVYNLVDQEKTEERAKVLEAKARKRNARRMAKGKDPKERRLSFGEWLMNIGEAPVIYDELLTNRTSTMKK